MDKWFSIEVEPVPASRPRVSKWGTYYPKKHTAYAETLKTILDNVPPMEHRGPIEVSMMFVMPRYKTSDSPVHRADIDNLTKLPLDCLTSSKDGDKPRFWDDDCLVSVMKSYKRFAREDEEPHTRVKIKPITESPEDYVDRMFENE